jgi:L-seryl-tRNA(Ser) seleniumtransferase
MKGETPKLYQLREIPAVDQLLLRPRLSEWVARASRGFVVTEIQKVLAEVRGQVRAGQPAPALDAGALEDRILDKLHRSLSPRLRAVINATGVVLHTNLGRAPLSENARRTLSDVSGQYANLEYELTAGARSHRDQLVEELLVEILGCEAATVVNNNAAAVFLILNTLAAGREVVVSRGELVEIGGSFRIPDILARSGATLREVGTTNKTRASDYEAAIGSETALLLRVHPSNYRIRGFTERPELGELRELARRRQIPLVEDIGSGCLVDLSTHGIRDEPTAQASLAAGADLVCFSGDKLLGGPQAGVVAGARLLVDRIRKNPLMRTYRVEKLVYSALEATLASYRTGRALEEIPVLRLITMPIEELRRRGRRFARALEKAAPSAVTIECISGHSVVGGGSCPDSPLETMLVAVRSSRFSPNELEQRLRSQDPPIIVRLEEDRTLVDLRTVFEWQESSLRKGLVQALS